MSATPVAPVRSTQVLAAAKARRRRRIEAERETWRDEEYGLHLGEKRGRTELRWTVDRDPFVALMQITRLQLVLREALEAELVVAARANGYGWSDVGFALGVTRQAAQKRHSGVDDLAADVIVDRNAAVIA